MSLLNFENLRSCNALNEILKLIFEHKKKNKHFSIKRWSEELGFRSPRGISMVLKGQRLPSWNMAQKIAQELKLDFSSKKLFFLLIEKEKKMKDPLELKRINFALEELKKTKRIEVLSAYFFLKKSSLNKMDQELKNLIRNLVKKHNCPCGIPSQIQLALEMRTTRPNETNKKAI